MDCLLVRGSNTQMPKSRRRWTTDTHFGGEVTLDVSDGRFVGFLVGEACTPRTRSAREQHRVT